MLQLRIPMDSILTEYYNLLVVTVQTNIQDSVLSNNVKNYLEANLKSILIGNPSTLLNQHGDLLNILFDDLADYDDFLKMERRPRRDDKLLIFNKYQNLFNHVEKIFDYKNIISENKTISYSLAEKLNVNTCTYCNRLYTNTITSKNDKIARPQFDHWFYKKKYPVLALSFYNLIPSCSVCNSNLKGSKLFKLDEHIHPYIKDDNETFSFSYNKKSLIENNVKISVDNPSKMLNTIQVFKLNEVYNAHSGFELKDLLDLRYKYSDNYLDILFNDTFNMKISKEEVYRLIFGVEAKEEDFHKRPFSKFKNDILAELGVKI